MPGSRAVANVVGVALGGKPVVDDAAYTVALQGYHVASSESYLAVTREELTAAGEAKVVTTSAADVLEEWLRNHQNIGRAVEGRLRYE